MLRPHSSPFGRVSLEFPQTRELLLRVTLLMLRGNLVAPRSRTAATGSPALATRHWPLTTLIGISWSRRETIKVSSTEHQGSWLPLCSCPLSCPKASSQGR